jgi:hypothetical protein
MKTTKELIQLHSSSDTHTPSGKEMLSVLEKLHKIEEKNKCLRVKFLDWLSDKLLFWSKKVKDLSDSIDSPCIIKIGEKK